MYYDLKDIKLIKLNLHFFYAFEHLSCLEILDNERAVALTKMKMAIIDVHISPVQNQIVFLEVEFFHLCENRLEPKNFMIYYKRKLYISDLKIIPKKYV